MAGRNHRQALEEFITWTREAFNKRDLEAYLSQYTDDAVYMWPDGPAIEGSVALRRFFTTRFAEFDATLENETLEIQIEGSLAFERGRSTARVRPKGGGEEQTIHEKYVNIFRLQTDGSWRLARRIRNRDHPPA
jgi:uncharacterized protein (TIGR02246 family)